MPFEEAAVLQLAISTAASALFQTDQLGLRHPTAAQPPDESAGSNEAIVVWGGSTSVGSNAIQLAVAAGIEVVTTASPHNHDRALRLGASRVFDYASPTVVADVAAALRGRSVAGVFAVGTGSAEPSVAIAVGTGARRVCLASPSVSFANLSRRNGINVSIVRVMARLVGGNVALQVRCRAHRLRARFVWGSSLMNNEVGPMLWEDFLPGALAEGRYLAEPAPEVVGIGLEHVQSALDGLRCGVSARKLVVALQADPLGAASTDTDTARRSPLDDQRGPKGPRSRTVCSAGRSGALALVLGATGPRRALAVEPLGLAQTQNQLRPDLDAESVVDQLWGACYHRLLLPDQPLDDAFVDTIVDNLFCGLRPGGHSPRNSPERGD